MKKLTVFAVALVALGLVGTASARTGGYSGHLLYSLESVTDYNTSSTETAIKGYTVKKNQFFDGQVIEMEAYGDVGITSSPTLVVDVMVGGSTMIESSALAMAAGTIRIKAVGVVRTVDSVSSGTRTAGTILWSLHISLNAGTASTEYIDVDTTADSVQTNIPDQDITLAFTWSASSASNTLKIEQFTIKTY